MSIDYIEGEGGQLVETGQTLPFKEWDDLYDVDCDADGYFSLQTCPACYGPHAHRNSENPYATKSSPKVPEFECDDCGARSDTEVRQ